MMYNERDKDFCRSEAFELVSSRADLISQRLRITYINMKQEFITGRTFSITCRGFRNPIYEAEWKGFMFTMYDQEDPPNAIETTGRDLIFNSIGFLPAKISLQGMRIQPTIFTIAEYSQWTASITDFPIPLDTECFVEITIPGDLAYKNEGMIGSQMFAPAAGSAIFPQVETIPDGRTILRFESCFR